MKGQGASRERNGQIDRKDRTERRNLATQQSESDRKREREGGGGGREEGGD